ncbi:MAG: preprotein translocase subunit YajC [Candidatus Binatia bacterium]
MDVAWAQSFGGGEGGPPPAIVSLIPFVGVFAIMYFLLIRPEQKRRAEHERLVAALKRNDQVVVGGILGRVATLGEKVIGVEIARGITVQVERGAIQRVEQPNGTETREKEREKP